MTYPIIRPGDTVLVSVTHPASMGDLDQLRADVAEAMPDVRVVVLEQLHVEGVFRPAEEA